MRVTSGFIFDSPHSGADYPTCFLKGARLGAQAIRRSEDAHVDRLFLPVAREGAPLMRARFPRAFLDLNREPYELDPRCSRGRCPPSPITRSIRVAGGLGTIPRIVADGQEIYPGKLPVAEALSRNRDPVQALSSRPAAARHGESGAIRLCALIDCHSMPSTSLSAEALSQVDIVLGDRYGSSCIPVLTDLVEAALRLAASAWRATSPMPEVSSPSIYGEPGIHRHALQIEINRAPYMHEPTLTPHAWFDEIAQGLCGAFGDVIAAGALFGEPPAIAAE